MDILLVPFNGRPKKMLIGSLIVHKDFNFFVSRGTPLSDSRLAWYLDFLTVSAPRRNSGGALFI